MGYYLTIDYGTQSVRAMIFDKQGELLGKETIVAEPFLSEESGWAEQEAGVFWTNLGEVCQRLFRYYPMYRNKIKAVALTTQRGTVINVDTKGDPLRPAIIWLDQRQCENPPQPHFLWRQLFRCLGVSTTLRQFQKKAEANWIYRNQRDIWEKTDKFLLLSGYLSFKLVGEMVDSIGSQVGYIPFDYKKHKWAHPLSWKWGAVAMPQNKLPRLIPQGEILGRITTEAAAITGIPEGLPLIAAAADKACEVIGSGCLEPEIGCLSYGTTASISTNSARYIETTAYVPPYPSAIPGYFNTEVHVQKGYWLVSWFKREFAHKEVAEALATGVQAEDLLEDGIRDIEPGSEGLLVQPFWSPGVRFPGPEAKGAMIGFHGGHTRPHIYRAILEGIAYALRDGRHEIEKATGHKITKLRCSGGGSRSDTVMQITADIFDLPVERPHTFETSGLGAAIIAAVGIGDYPDFATAMKAMTRTKQVFYPRQPHVKTYDHLYHKVYQKLYASLKPLYQELDYSH